MTFSPKDNLADSEGFLRDAGSSNHELSSRATWSIASSRSDASSHRPEFTDRERELLHAWDRTTAPDELDDMLEHRLFTAYECARDLTLAELEDADRATRLAMAAECDAEAERIGREFEEIATQHEGYLHRIALRLSGDKETAKDLVQETLARALLRFADFERGTNIRGWLVTILTRWYYDTLKHSRVISRAEDELVRLATADREPETASIADTQLWAAVKALEPDLRSVVERCYMQDMSYKAIADELKVPVGTIGTRLRRARERLKALLSA